MAACIPAAAASAIKVVNGMIMTLQSQAACCTGDRASHAPDAAKFCVTVEGCQAYEIHGGWNNAGKATLEYHMMRVQASLNFTTSCMTLVLV